MGTLWEIDGHIVEDSGNSLVECDDCPCADSWCTICQDGTAPDNISVTLGTVTDQDCTLCDESFSGQIYTCAKTGNACIWSYSFDPPGSGPCDAVYVMFSLATVGVNTYAYVDLYLDVGYIRWSANLGTGLIDCSSFSSLALAYTSDNTSQCAGSGTAYATSL